MVDPLTLRRWTYRAGFLAVSACVIFIHILPFHISADALPAPDLLVLLAFAWVLRKPAYVPVLLVAGVILVSDILFMRPLGLWTALVLLGLEFLRVRRNVSAELPFLVEWMMVTAVLFALTILNGLVLALFAVPRPPLTAILVHVFITAACYPAVVAFSAFVMGVRSAGPAEREGSRA
ncbi:rod shape-determining protein MreD [Palleronia sp. LCG004]|uniref:rod shape-determining protein MreD n=1 Tax=Palleronia sp. LCG004 TaxID=3079304 RepID=UPI002941D6CB|nr:rod shape-determining protein MreD [Palleronia sp. LCG004]WOI56254.1 rod shape-determining protein MreD [Palleronia sp. LCG004]